MGRWILILAVSAFWCALAACEKKVAETKPPDVKSPPAAITPAVTPSIPKDGNYDGRGEVTKINMELGSVELKHEEIKDLMPPMQMEFFVKDKAILKGLIIGDRVDFVVEYKHPQEFITSIKKAP
jgi:Cu/Ag efflux protein CusF